MPPLRSRASAPILLVAALFSVSFARCLVGCTAAQGRAVEAGGLQLGELACEALLPLATPGYAALDVLACKGAEAAIDAALAAALAAAGTPAPVVGQSVVLAHRPLRQGGKVVAMVRAPLEVVARAQVALDRGAK